MSEDTLTIKVQLNEDDLRRFWEHAMERQGAKPSRTKLALTWLMFLPMLALVPYLFTEVKTDGEMKWTILLLMAFGGYVIMAYEKQRSGQLARWMQSEDTKCLLQPTLMTIAADGITSESQRMRSWYEWSMVSDVKRSDARIYVWLGSARCYILPERSFQGAAEVATLLETIDKYRTMAAGAKLECPKCSYDLRGDASSGCPECGWGALKLSLLFADNCSEPSGVLACSVRPFAR